MARPVRIDSPTAPAATRRLEMLRRWSFLLDRAFRVPGTRFRFGWDAIIGLVPGLGDLVTAFFSCLLLLESFQARIPKIVQVRMMFNILIDLVVGYIPVLGDLFDFAWQSNTKNMRLYERYAERGQKPTPGDWIFVAAMLLLIALLVGLPVLALAWMIERVGLF